MQLQTLLDLLYATSEGLAAESLEQVVPSRRLHLPVVFNDSGLKGTIERYMASTGRKKAVYLPDNLDYLARANGLNSVDEVVSTFCKADWYVVSRSFFAGLPMMGPFDHRSIFKSQKYKCASLLHFLCTSSDFRLFPAQPAPSRPPARLVSQASWPQPIPSIRQAATSSLARR